MKCPNCGAEVGTNQVCEYCGIQITSSMRHEQEQLSKEGCPKCGSSNIQFRRENKGEIRGKNSKRIIHETIGFCKDCGYTWEPQRIKSTSPAKSNTVWWILGWIFFFPAPVMVLIWRKKNTWSTGKKIAATVIFWILLFILSAIAGNNGESQNKQINSNAQQTGQITEQQVFCSMATLDL